MLPSRAGCSGGTGRPYPEARVGVATADIARVFLVSEPTMAARITRAKKNIVGSRVPYRVPRSVELPGRLQGSE